MHHSAVLAAGVALLGALPCAHAGLYLKSSPVIQVDGKSYDRLIAKSNYTSIVEFYAPWCGHCQNLKPAYEKAAKNLDGLAKVAAVNCDEDANKPLCGKMGVQGFPTLKIVRPSKNPGGRPVVEDYNGARTATGIVEAVVDKINNHVQRVTDKDIDKFLAAGSGPKAILFTNKGTTSALLRSVAIDFLGAIAVGQVRDKEAKTIAKYAVTEFPTLVLLPGDDKEPVVFDGKFNKESIVQFLSQVAEPNPDPAPAKGKGKADKKAEKKTEKKKPAKEAKPKEAEKPAEEAPKADEAADSPTAEASAAPAAPTIVPIRALEKAEDLTAECFTAKSHTCVLALVPAARGEGAEKALGSLAELSHKYIQGKRHLFPFFEVADSNPQAAKLKEALGLTGEVELVAVNARRGWWRRHEGDLGVEGVEGWIDAIRMSEGTKSKLPEGLVAQEKEEEAASSAASQPAEEPAATEEEAKPSEKTHDELWSATVERD